MTPTLAPKSIFPVLLFILAVLYSFSGIFFGLDFTDSFYHLNQALRPAKGVYLYPFFLSSVIIKNITEFIGTDVIYIRTVNWLLLFISMLLPFVFLKISEKKSIILSYLIITILLHTPFNANILGYDTLSIFMNSLLFTLTALYFKKSSIYLICLIAIVGAISTLIRLPNILVIPIIFIFILISDKISGKNEILIRPIFFISLTLLFVVSGFSMYYDNWDQFIGASLITETSFHHILKNYFMDGVKIAGFTFFILLGLVLYEKNKDKYQTYLVQGFILSYFLLIFYFLIKASKYSLNYSFFVVALSISIVIIQLLYKTESFKPKQKRLISYLFLFFLFINPFGSNTGLLKAYSLTFLLAFVLSINEVQHKEYWKLLLLVLIPFSILTKFVGIYEDKNLYSLSEKIEFGELTNVYTNKDRKNFLLETDMIVKQLQERGIEVFFYGDKSHVFSYLYPKTSFNLNRFSQPEKDLFEIDEVLKTVEGKAGVAIILITQYPEREDPSEIIWQQSELNYYGFREVSDGNVKYFLKM